MMAASMRVALLPAWALAVALVAGCPSGPGQRPDAAGVGGARQDGAPGNLDSGGGGTGGGVGAIRPDGGPAGVFVEGVMTWWAKPNRKLDVLFMIDSSAGMEPAQATLRGGLPGFMNVLKGLPDGQPDLHIGVVTSDMGVGHGDIVGCTVAGDKGVLKLGAAAGACAATLSGGARYLTSTGGPAPQNNFTGDITAALQCMTQVGATGCNFERPLDSVARALGADGFAPAENQGFLRPDAMLALVLLSNEDDCSAAPPGIYDVGSDITLASVLGPPGKFRCAEFGHLCNGAPPARRAPNGLVTDTVNYAGCVSAEDQGRLVPVARFVQGIQALKANPLGEILVASIHGPTTPYQIHWKAAAATDVGPWPEITHACTANNGSFADPGVRIQQFVRSFESNGLSYSICDADYGAALQNIARRVGQLGGRGCFAATFVDEDGNAANGVQADCTVRDRVPNGSGGVDDRLLSACADNGNIPPCWRIIAASSSPASCPTGTSQLLVDRGTTTVSDNTVTEARCALCAPGVRDPAHGCP